MISSNCWMLYLVINTDKWEWTCQLFLDYFQQKNIHLVQCNSVIYCMIFFDRFWTTIEVRGIHRGEGKRRNFILHLFSTVDQPLLLWRYPFFLLHSLLNPLHLGGNEHKTLLLKHTLNNNEHTWGNKRRVHTLSVGSMSISISLPVSVWDWQKNEKITRPDTTQ